MKNIENKRLAEIIETADYQGLREFFDGMTASELKSFAKTAVAAYKKASQELTLRAAFNAMIVTCDDENLPEKISFWFVHSSTFDLTLIKSLRSTIAPAIIEKLVEQERIAPDTISMLAEEGLITTPDTDSFVKLIMKSGPQHSGDNSYHPERLSIGTTFFDHYVWRLFEVEGSNESSLAAHDKYSAPDSTWSSMLLKATEDKSLSRSRALDASLDSLDQGFAQFRAGWHSRFHEELRPTLAERFQRKEKYAHLLGSPTPSTVTMALNALIVVAKEYSLPVELILQNIEAPLFAKAKSTALSALKLIDETILTNPAAVRELSSIACSALLHHSPEVQKCAVQLIAKHNERIEDSLRMQLIEYIDALSPSVRRLIATLLNDSDVRPKDSSSLYKLSKNAPPSPLLTCSNIQPIETIDDLLASCTYLLEHLDDVIELERVLDAAVRLSDKPAEDFALRSAPILKRAHTLQKTCQNHDGVLDTLNFIAKWLGGDELEHSYSRSSMSKFMSRRFQTIMKQIEEKSRLPLLSIPTQTNGFIDPEILLKRWQKWIDTGKTPAAEDQAIALFRLPLMRFDFSNTDVYAGDFWDAVRFASKLSDNVTSPSRTESLVWLAAESVRMPPAVAASFKLDDEPLFVNLGLDTTARCALTWFPSVRAIFVATGIRALAASIDYFYSTDQGLEVYLEPLLDKSFEFDRRSYCILAAANISQSTSISGVARDITIEKIENRSLDIESFAIEINKLLFHPQAKIQRLVSSLSEVARVSSLHTNAIRQVVEAALEGGEHIPNGFALLLEFFNELLHSDNTKITNDKTVQFLQSIAKSGKTKKLVKELLAQ
ncbi:hypothetical protein KF728_07285 [Candidatus Obscuribacterales bacterium]|nr:hypothetical protein [Candidatus Obscuribacterales bacterium]MBX3149930.1 hypothetical protein [Candidatus Obscuribacterales bacterium]